MVPLIFFMFPTYLQALTGTYYGLIQSLYAPEDIITFQKNSSRQCSIACGQVKNCVGFSFKENVAHQKIVYMENEDTGTNLKSAVDGGYSTHYTNCAINLFEFEFEFGMQYVGIDLQDRYIISHGRVLSRSSWDPAVVKHFENVDVSVGDTRASSSTLSDNAVCAKKVGGVVGWNNFECGYLLTGRHIVFYRAPHTHDMGICEAEIYGKLLSEWMKDK